MTKFYLLVKRFLPVVLLASCCSMALAQGRSVSGKVTSSDDGSGVPGVNILEKGTSNGTVSDADGNYRINVGDNATLIFSFVGYATQEAAVGGQSVVNVTMQSDVTALSEVVVVGYGTQEKRDVTGALVSLKSEDFNAGVIASPEQLIQGRMAGVQVTSASGEPGASVNIRIRGTSSVRGGNNPLFVVDGVPLAGDDVSPGSGANGLGNSPPRNPLNFLNPNDIASIDVLKDASATAIYGSRGANGVVLITTKSGKSGKGALDYSYNLSVSTITKKYELLSPSEFISAYTAFNGPTAAATLNQGASTDWQDQVLRTSYSHNHNLSYGGGDKSGDYRFSFGYSDQQGIIKKSGLKRYSIRFNGNKKFIDDKLRIGTQITVGTTLDDNVPITNNSGFEGDLYGNALKANPTAPIFFDPTSPNGRGGYYQPSNTEPNPVAMLNLSKSFTNTIRALGNFSADYQITKNLNFKTVVGFDRSTSSRTSAYSKDLRVTGIFDNGRLYFNDIEIDNKLWENYFTYDKSFENSKLNALIGYSYQSFTNSSKNFHFTNFLTTDLDLMINNFASANQTPSADGKKAGVVGTNSSKVNDEIQSFYGRVNYSISDKYIFTATLRADGSTKFGGSNKYGYFPSGAFKWRMSDENFVPEAITDLNLRVGYGVTGNQEIPHNLYVQRQRYNDWGLNNDREVTGGGLGDVAFANPNLKWESTAQLNAGIDFGFGNNRFRGSIDYYHKNTSSLLIQVQSAQPAAQPFVWTNLNANVINKGVELVLEADAISNVDFKWTVVGNVAFNDNKVTNFGGLINTGEINGQGLTGAFAQRIANNQPLYSYFLREFAGYDANGISVYAGGDLQKFVGRSPLPTTNMGLTNNLKYKNLDLSIFFSGQFGQYIYSNTANAYFTAGSLSNGRNVQKESTGIGTSSSGVTTYNGEGALNAPDVSTRFLQNGSFVRLQNLTLGYNMKTASTAISSLRFFVTGQNLLTFTPYTLGQDPEVNVNKNINNVPSLGIDYGAYPRARIFTVGFNISF